jgi:hypothetical protein
MKRSHQFNEASYWPSKGLSGNVAVHEAGHAAAIYLGNKRKGLPPVFFQVLITPQEEKTPVDKYLLKPGSAFIAEVDGGGLIPILPSSFKEATLDFSPEQKLSYQRAFEADMVNLLVGPLAEAKYIAHNDGERFNPLLVTLNALHYYGGCYDLATFFSYLECYLDNETLREEKITGLYLEAFNFVIGKSNWHAITALADYLAGSDQLAIDCNEIIGVIKKANSDYAFARSGECSLQVDCVKQT